MSDNHESTPATSGSKSTAKQLLEVLVLALATAGLLSLFGGNPKNLFILSLGMFGLLSLAKHMQHWLVKILVRVLIAALALMIFVPAVLELTVPDLNRAFMRKFASYNMWFATKIDPLGLEGQKIEKSVVEKRREDLTTRYQKRVEGILKSRTGDDPETEKRINRELIVAQQEQTELLRTLESYNSGSGDTGGTLNSPSSNAPVGNSNSDVANSAACQTKSTTTTDGTVEYFADCVKPFAIGKVNGKTVTVKHLGGQIQPHPERARDFVSPLEGYELTEEQKPDTWKPYMPDPSQPLYALLVLVDGKTHCFKRGQTELRIVREKTGETEVSLQFNGAKTWFGRHTGSLKLQLK